MRRGCRILYSVLAPAASGRWTTSSLPSQALTDSASQCVGFEVLKWNVGVYYAAQDLITAIRETVYHLARFATDSNDSA
ncbi:RES domain-containing protein [Candidatus Binatus sp.]|uniref:RES domain-containing protein n=1 Tax=Candidatus Binatus sp. TaxID=2811406 RepID=UPI003D0DC42C